jgi:Flp pilus assembly protein TadG
MTNLVETSVMSDTKPKPGLLRRFRKDKRGSVAIEFVMLAMPFSLLVFAIIESCIAFAAQQVMSNAVDTVGREIRVGNLQAADITPAILRTKICEQMSLLVTAGCPGLEIDLNKYANWATVPTTIPRTSDGDVNTAGFTVVAGIDREIQHLRIFYRWPYVSDFIGHKIAELPNNKTLLYASMTWKNEPFNVR